MTLNPYKLIKYQLYLLQLENYELGRFWKLLINKGYFPVKEQRKNLVWTAKAKAIFIVGVFFHITTSFFITSFFKNAFFEIGIKYLALSILLFLAGFFLYPILYTIAALILWPIDWLAKKIIVGRARSYILNFGPAITIIGVAGSYGKTTMKEVLATVLSSRFKVLATPESINTPVGIARWILQTINNRTQVLIVEMGEHYRGDIKELCRLAQPDISVITGINESHLERMGSLHNVISTIFEITSGSKTQSLVMINADDKNIMSHYTEFVLPDQKVEKFTIGNLKFKVFNTEKLCWEAEAEGVGKIEVPLLGEYALGNADAAIQIAKKLGMGDQEIISGIKNIKPIEHRLQPIKSAGNVLVIDDAYNGNPAGVAEAIRVLNKFIGRRKIYITPGLVETGKSADEVHYEIGRQLAPVANIVVLIKNSVTPKIELGIKNSGLENSAKPKIIWFDTATDAHASLAKILEPNDVVLFQNDWGDQYL